ncbi:hypothetical protein [Streptomyces sp. OP7]|uniref:hypothetical protein n=1 Tax=Streptomyces sp. OP7 TaxID=3142462 RepID=UPI0032E8E73A
MAQKIDNEPWERWPDEVMTEVNGESWGFGSEPVSGDYSGLPWDEYREPGQSWAAYIEEDFTDPGDFAEEVWRQAKTANLGVDLIVWGGQVVFFRFREDLMAVAAA